MPYKRLAIRLVLWFLALICAVSVASSVDAAEPTAQDIEEIISKAGIFPPGTQLNASIAPPQAIVSTYKVPRANEKDMKIDAILVSRKIMQDSSGIKKVRVLFYETSPNADLKQVDVSVSDIKAFECGATSQEDLLSSLDVVSQPRQDVPKVKQPVPPATATIPEVDPCDKPQVAKKPVRMKLARSSDWLYAQSVNDGPFKSDRLGLLGRIQELAKHGDVTQVVNYFARVEQKVQEGDKVAVANGVMHLRNAVTAGEKAWQQQRGFLTVQTGHVQNIRTADGLLTECFFNPSVATKQMLAIHLGKELGNDAPRSGPLLERRYQIATTIRLYKRCGKNTAPYEAYYRAIERLIPTAAPELVRHYVENLETALELPHTEIAPTKS